MDSAIGRGRAGLVKPAVALDTQLSPAVRSRKASGDDQTRARDRGGMFPATRLPPPPRGGRPRTAVVALAGAPPSASRGDPP